jgi:type IV pilus assembly protein PilW
VNLKRSSPELRRQGGAGLIELLIGTVLGLFVLAALGYFFLGGRQINRASDDVMRMQESGRNALEVLGRAMRQAGYRNDWQKLWDPWGGTAVTGTDGASGAPDTITVQYEAQTGGEANCLGANVAAGDLVTAGFAIDAASDPPALTCNGTAVVLNVEDMQIEYGIDASRDGNVEFYKTAPSGAEFGQVAVVHVSLLVRGASGGVAANNTQTVTFNGAEVTKTDGYLRQVFNGTFTLRNQAY